MRAFDAHAHLDFPVFDDDREAVLARAREVGVTRVHVAGYGPEGFARQRALARYEGVSFGFGLHPWWVARASEAELDAGLDVLDEALRKGDACSLGELGLDTRRCPKESLPRQRRAFLAQLALARTEGLPIVLHVVGAQGEALSLLEAARPLPPGLVHGFTGAPELAARYPALGLHVSFGPAITREAAHRARMSASRAPLDRLLVETDAPDGASEPAELVRVLGALAALRAEPIEALAEASFENAARLFAPTQRR